MLKFFTPLVFLLTLSAGQVTANQGNDFDISDATSVNEAVELISFALENQGLDIVATLNHSAAAASVGLVLRPTTVILASKPRLESKLISRSQTAAIEAPLKFLVFEDENGVINLEFNEEGYVLDRHSFRTRDRLLRKLDRVINQFGRAKNGLINVPSNQSVEDTVATLLTALEARRFKVPVPGGIDYQAQAAKYGIYLPPTTLVIFGNPNVGTPLMQNDQSIGLDLPQKFLISEDHYGQVSIVFNAPKFLAKKHNLQRDADPTLTLEARLTTITNALTGLAQLSANPAP